MKTTPKLSSEERRAAIISAVRQVFAEKGFHGTTTRELAEAAGVSEALLFKHFPTKEALFTAMQMFCCNQRNPEKLERIRSLEPSTSTLAVIVHLMVTRMVGQGNEDMALHHRLMLRSMMEDGEFARLFLQRVLPEWVGKVQQCLEASVAAGDASPGPVRPELGALFARHLAAMIMISLLPHQPIIEYHVPRAALVEQAVWFILRGLGIDDDAIRRTYNAQALSVLMS